MAKPPKAEDTLTPEEQAYFEAKWAEDPKALTQDPNPEFEALRNSFKEQSAEPAPARLTEEEELEMLRGLGYDV
jgi:hypothetical protein